MMNGNVFIASGTADDIPRALQMINESDIVIAKADLYVRSYRSFGIDDAHEMRERASGKAIGERRAFVISAGAITTEAQNALLKTLEEPPGNALFIFIVPAPLVLLGTVRSRAQIIDLALNPVSAGGVASSATQFLKATPARRLEMLKVVLQKSDDDKYDMSAILSFLAHLETAASSMKNAVAKKETLEAIYCARQYVTDRGALVKTLLESVALLTPML